ncbi:hypothetical protein [uncultured Bacteroides sp.]|uniref:hypothetical protein n=1 Tax=uncultured Bacteroides sp. TaxID=162156 RepID=UPI00262A5E7F|nr:hypothetical protein [uncultured Bacteroides sp.]
MKTFSSQMSEKAKGCVWMSMMYSVTAIVLCIVLVLLSEKNVDNLIPFISCFIFMALSSCIRIYHIEYSIADEYLNIRDFKYRSINIFDIKEITILKEKKRFTLNIPYDTVIIEKNGKKTYISPENRDMMLETIKGINPEITFSISKNITFTDRHKRIKKLQY